MFKNMTKRAWLSTIRKPGKSILIGLILFAMANLVLATLTINQAVDKQTEYAKESLGGTVYLQTDMEALREQMTANMENRDENSSPTPVRISRPTVPIDTAEKIAESNYVKDYSYSLNAMAQASSFEPVEQSSSIPSGIMMGGPRFGGSDEESTTLESNISLESANSYAFLSAVTNNQLSYEGNYFDETTGNGAMISAELALSAGLEVGDVITLKNIYTSTDVDLEIIGIYTNSSDNFNENLVYTNVATAANFLEEDAENLGVGTVTYYMVNAESADAFIAEINEKYPTLKEDGLSLDIDTSAYEQMVGPITSVGSFSTTILVVVIIASVAIIALIVILNIRERRYEMGVLLSLGATKMNIIGGIAAELFLVGTIFFALSTLTSTALASAMGQSLLESQISMNETTSEQNFGRGNNSTRGTMARPGGENTPPIEMNNNRTMTFGRANSDAEPISEIDISTNAGTYALLFVLGYGILLVALAFPSINILRYQPKEILTGKE